MNDQMCRCYLPYPEEHPYPPGGGCLCSCHNVWAERVRRNITPPPVRDEDPDTTRARAITRARTERQESKP
jgi:hypothetical protein